MPAQLTRRRRPRRSALASRLDARLLAAQAAQVIELGAAHLAAAHHLDRVDHRRIEREHALDAFAVGDLAHGEVLVQPAPGAADADAFVGLHAALVALDHLDVDQHGVARGELRNFFAGRELLDLLFFERLDEVHGSISSAAPASGARCLFGPEWVGGLLDQRLRVVIGLIHWPGLAERAECGSVLAGH